MTYSPLSLTAEEIRARGGGEIIPDGEISDVEEKLQITLSRPVGTPIRYGDIKDIAKDTVYYPRTTTFKMDCIVEKIPVPKTNRILGLSITPRNTISKNAVVYIDRYDNEVFLPENYINNIGTNMGITISGDLHAKYDLVVKDITNTKWYNWKKEEFQHGYSSSRGIVDFKPKPLAIPPQTIETKYNLFFTPIGASIYNSGLPTEENPWSIYQLQKAKTTFQFNDTSNGLFVSETTSSVTYNPGVMINAGSANDGKVEITITVLPKRGTIGLLEAFVNMENIIPSGGSSVDLTEILSVELTASINSSGSVGTITGTVVLGKSSLRNSTYLIDPNNFFTIT